MKTSCEGCALALTAGTEGYVCSSGCTFCTDCAATMQDVCPNCGDNLLRRATHSPIAFRLSHGERSSQIDRPAVIWGLSFGIWSVIAFIGTLTIYKLYRTTDSPMLFKTTLAWEFCQILTYVPLTPFSFAFANRFPIRRDNWGKRSLLYLAAGLVFAVAHIALRAVTPYAYFDSKARHFESAIWDAQTHVFKVQWAVLQRQFFGGVVDDITGTFFPIVLIAHAVSYYRRFRERELRAVQLEGQLAQAHLQSLKIQLQPHFLFNTMHSISALMMTDVQAADRMMTRLGDLLRMSLESAGTQITHLSREIEFLNCYLEIEKVRFAERLNVILDIAPETADAMVPHLLLQPLVDNAIKHGISKLTAGGEIRITVTAHDGELEIEITDNGPGLLNADTSAARGVGLRITRERLESLYGQKQSLELLSPVAGGTVTRVCIPFRVQPVEREHPGDDQTLRQAG